MSSEDPGEFSIGDVIRAACMNPLDAIILADGAEPAIEEQVRAPTDKERAEIEQLAIQAARLQDEIRSSPIGDKQRELKALRAQLKLKFLAHGLDELTIPGRPAIELNTSSSRKATRKSIIGVLEKAAVEQLNDGERKDPKKLKQAKADAKMKAVNLWNKIEPTKSQSISIPDPSPDEVEAPY